MRSLPEGAHKAVRHDLPDDSGRLPLTGERTVPGVAAENYWFRRHEAAYEWLLPAIKGRHVLEVGCGEGYGTATIAEVARSVLGIDYDVLAVRHARRTYPGASFARANLAAIPVRTDGVDALACLQVIEHVWDHPQFVAECVRVVRPGGTIAVTTPNRLTFSPGRERPVNPFHTHEFTAAELVGLLTEAGARVHTVLGLHAGPRLIELDGRWGSFVDAQLATLPAQWSAGLAADVASVGIADFVVRPDRLDDSLDLLVIATPGDGARIEKRHP
jgi:2-polyprenyl-3-methyl-5-hydroxy-6-metoxy-1,4-benzoquinol methylase